MRAGGQWLMLWSHGRPVTQHTENEITESTSRLHLVVFVQEFCLKCYRVNANDSIASDFHNARRNGHDTFVMFGSR